MSDTVLTVDTEVVLLLCGRFGGERENPFQPLSTREYAELARWLNLRGLRPSDLITEAGRLQLPAVHEAKLETRRIEFLLGRGTAMAFALERWSRGGLWVISRGDVEFPKRLKRLLKHGAPPLLYGAGKKELLDIGGLAIIGSRDATEAALEFTRGVAAKCASEGMGVVSGGARGVDAAAMQGATEAGGYTLGVLASDLLKSSVNKQNRLGLQEGRLVLVSPFYPEAGFNAGNAMGRNKYIYALSDRALVVDAALDSGGTWEGALAALKERWVPLYVRIPGSGAGNAALVERGGLPFTYEPSRDGKLLDFLEDVESSLEKTPANVIVQKSLLEHSEEPTNTAEPVSKTINNNLLPSPVDAIEQETDALVLGLRIAEESPPLYAADLAQNASLQLTLDMYADFLSKVSNVLNTGPRTEEEIAECLGLEKGQTKTWLKKAVDSGQVERLMKPTRYGRGFQASLLG